MTMATSGEKLLESIQEALPKFSRKSEILWDIDHFFNEDGRLLKLLEKSIYAYALRRILYSAQCMLEEEGVTHDSIRGLDVIRKYISSNTCIEEDSPEKERLAQQVYACIEISQKDIPKGIRNRIIEDSKDRGATTCYMCGEELDFTNSQSKQAATLEHVFPQELGGDSDESNLVLACRDCNELKSNYINYSDYHFELITTKHAEKHKKFKKRLFRSYNSIAIWASNENKCSQCDKPATEVGFLKATRRSREDGWHFTNLTTFCSNH